MIDELIRVSELLEEIPDENLKEEISDGIIDLMTACADRKLIAFHIKTLDPLFLKTLRNMTAKVESDNSE